MATLLYHWDFTGSNDLNLEDSINDSESSLVAKVKRRGTYSSSSFSRSSEGISLNNNDSTNGGYYIELDGLNTTSLGGNISIEMVVQNHDRTYKGLYFSSTNAQGLTTSDGATIVARFNNKTKLLSRPDSTNSVTYNNYRNVNESSSTVVTDNSEFHYIFTVFHDNSSSSLKIYINGDKKGENNADLEGVLTSTVRGSNLIGTHKEQLNATYLKGVVKYLKIYQNAMDDDEAESAYNSYYWNNDFSSSTDSEKYTRRHSDVSDYFSINSGKTSFITKGNQLGLINSDENYTIHKFTNGETIDINSGFHYIPLSGQNQYIILQNDSKWYKITQTSSTDGSGSTYKYETSTDGDNFSNAVENKGFGDTVEIDNITLGFGGVESAATPSGDICFLGSELVLTDQGKIRIDKLTTNNTIFNYKIQKIVKVFNSDDSLILIYKDALGPNVPSKNTFISINHGIYLDNCVIDTHKLKTSYNNVNFQIKGKNMVRARNLTVLPKIIKINKIGKHKIYNVLLDIHYKMNVNGLICETLHPLSIKK